jgi:hypothetical protein
MPTKKILGQWIALRSKDGIEHASRRVFYLSVAAFALATIAILASTLAAIPAIAFLFPGIAIGWLLAERNALQSRIEQWPALSEYLDWDKIERDNVGE